MVNFSKIAIKKYRNFFEQTDKSEALRMRSIDLIPSKGDRFGGKSSFVEWANVAGIFQTLIAQNCTHPCRVLDIGCGHGLLGISCLQLIDNQGYYHGIDIKEECIEFCKTNFKKQTNYIFTHVNIYNEHYNRNGESKNKYPIQECSEDLVTALSVFTHLHQNEFSDLLSEISRILRPKGKAIITLFLLDDRYNPEYLATLERSNFHKTSPNKWVFDKDIDDNYSTPSWARVNNAAVAVKSECFKRLLEENRFRISSRFSGTWKETPGLYFQDVVVLEKQ